ncbi:unnamed protein product [Scytosiphon promiscuus]
MSAPVSPGRRRKAGAFTSAASPPTARVATVPGHKTVRLRPRVYEVPTLGFLCVQMLAEHSDRIVDLRGVGEEAARQLLREIMGRQKLTYPLAKVFMECGDDELSRRVHALCYCGVLFSTIISYKYCLMAPGLWLKRAGFKELTW